MSRQGRPSAPRIPLCRLPTPVTTHPHILRDLVGAGAPELLVKRDDLTHAALSGNKVRKLEHLLAEAKEAQADTVVTCGGIQSNHCRATALAAAQLGLRCLLLLRTDDPDRPPPPTGNLLLCRMSGAEIRLVSPAAYRERTRLFSEITVELSQAGRRAYVIPEGGSCALGALGYVTCVEELRAELGPGPLTIVYAAGSGGTGAGLLLGAALHDLPWRIIGVNVCDDRAHFVRVIGDILAEAAARFQLPAARRLSDSREAIDIRDGYVGLGYARSRPEELRLLVDVCRREGLVLDPVYTGKAFFGLVSELSRDPASLGPRVVFLHSGGIFGLFPQADALAPLLA